MFKLLAFVALLSLAVARPSYLAPATIIHEPAVVGHVVHSVPSAVSHSSHTQIHTRPVITPIVHAVPVVHSSWVHPHVVAAPIVAHHDLHAPILVHA